MPPGRADYLECLQITLELDGSILSTIVGHDLLDEAEPVEQSSTDRRFKNLMTAPEVAAGQVATSGHSLR